MKKIIAFVLMLTMVLSLFTVMASAVVLPDGTDMPAGYSDGTDHKEWTKIETAAQFKQIKCGGKYYLAANIDLTAEGVNFAPLAGGGNSAEVIILDGCGYTVTTNKPLFEELPGGNVAGVHSEIKNLVIEGSITVTKEEITAYSNGLSVGALVGKANGGIFTNIVNNASVTLSDEADARVGGIVGAAFNEGVKFVNCVNNGDVNGYITGSTISGVGGIIGSAGCGAYAVIFDNCKNTGTVKNAITEGENIYVNNIIGNKYAGGTIFIFDEIEPTEYTVTGGITITGEPKAITKASEFTSMDADGVYYLTVDIELGGRVSGYGEFNGYLDGNGKTIKNGTSDPVFETLNGAYVEDLTITDVKITGVLTHSGALANTASNANIYNVSATGSITTGTVTTDNQSFGGLIGYLAAGSVIDCTADVDIVAKVNSTLKQQDLYVGGLVGVSSGDVSYVGCVNNGNLSATKETTLAYYTHTGGIVGHLGVRGGTGSGNASVIDCENYGTGTAGTTSGGMIGKMSSGGGSATIRNCKNYTAAIMTAGYAGGIVGFSQINWDTLSVTDCVNEAEVKAVGNSFAGGVIGYIGPAGRAPTATTKKNIVIKNCVNSGNITSTNAGAGGIVGIIKPSTAGNIIDTITIDSCENNAIVSGEKNYAGGIAGQIESLTTSSTVTVKNCVNNGKVISTKNTNSNNYSVAGIVSRIAGISGNEAKKVEFINCRNNGVIEAYARAAGIVSYAQYITTLNITDCVNTKNITSVMDKQQGGGYAGGIASVAWATTTNIKGCLNTGDVSCSMVVGGIAANTYALNVSYSLNTGDVTVNTLTDYGTTNRNRTAGGILGMANKAVNINYCGTTGDVAMLTTASNSALKTAGGVVGNNSGATTVTNTFMTGSVSATTGYTATTIGDGVTDTATVYIKGGANDDIADNITDEQIKNGYLAYKMIDSTGYWGQEINADATPVLGGEAVKKAEGAEVYYNEFIDATLTLKDDLTLNATANAAVLDESELTVKFTMNGETVTVDAADVADKYAVKASFADIAPQLIGEDIDIEFYLGETKLFSKTLSIVDYLEALVAQDVATTDIAKALLRYGYEAREFVINERGGVEADIAEITSDLLSTDALVAPTDVADMSYTKGAAYADDFRIYAAGVRFNNVNKLFFKLYIPEAKAATAKVTINGEEVAFEKDADGYVVFSEDIYAKAFGEQLTVVLYDGATEAYSVTYSIYNYAENMADDAKMGDLALATYYYGAAAAAYAG